MDQEYESNRPYQGGDNAATPPHHSWTIKLMEKTIARLTGAINQMRLQTKAVSPRGVIRIDKRIRQLAFCASLICPGILLLIVFREGSYTISAFRHRQNI